jgi:serine/threonine-protein kinase RsbW
MDLLHERDQIDGAVRTILDALARHKYTESSRFAVRLALEEGISNAFRHGHRTLPPGVPIHLSYLATDKELRVVIQDRGPGFDPASVPDPTLEQNLEVPSGRGLMLMRAYMTSVTFNPSGNQVTLIYQKPPAKG